MPGRIRGHLADPLFYNAYALMINTAATGLLGMAFWLLVARLYAPADVGRASAVYAAMNLVAGFTALNFTGALTRFIPQAGARTKGLVICAYAISCGTSAVLAIVFLLTVSSPGASYAQLHGLAAGIVFTGCVGVWAVFTLQDGVLTGLRSSIWVAAENSVFGIAKIVLLVALAALQPHFGIYISWMVPVLVAIPLVNILIFARLLPRHLRRSRDQPPPTFRQIGRFLAGDYTGSLCVLATTNLIPVIVATRIAPRWNAYFFVAWMIGSTLDLLAVNMATSLTVEGAFDGTSLAANTRAALRRSAVILVPVTAGLALASPLALGLFGPGYAEHGARILELLALAIVPKAVTELYLGALRALSRTSLVALIQGLRSALVLGLALVATGRLGLTGAGLAVLAGQLIIAAGVIPGMRRILAAPVPAAAAAAALAAR